MSEGEVIKVATVLAVAGVTIEKAGTETVTAAGAGKTGTVAETTATAVGTTKTALGTIRTVAGTIRIVAGTTRIVEGATKIKVAMVTTEVETTGIVEEAATKTVAGDVAGATSRGGTTELLVLQDVDSAW